MKRWFALSLVTLLIISSTLLYAQSGPKVYVDDEDKVPYYKVPVATMQEIIVAYRIMEQTAIALQEENEKLKKQKCKDS